MTIIMLEIERELFFFAFLFMRFRIISTPSIRNIRIAIFRDAITSHRACTRIWKLLIF